MTNRTEYLKATIRKYMFEYSSRMVLSDEDRVNHTAAEALHICKDIAAEELGYANFEAAKRALLPVPVVEAKDSTVDFVKRRGYERGQG